MTKKLSHAGYVRAIVYVFGNRAYVIRVVLSWYFSTISTLSRCPYHWVSSNGTSVRESVATSVWHLR